MKKNKIVFSLLATMLFVFSVQFADASCDGNHYTISDDTNVATEFSDNCCAGDQITTYNIHTGETETHTLMFVDGQNSSCAN